MGRPTGSGETGPADPARPVRGRAPVPTGLGPRPQESAHRTTSPKSSGATVRPGRYSTSSTLPTRKTRAVGGTPRAAARSEGVRFELGAVRCDASHLDHAELPGEVRGLGEEVGEGVQIRYFVSDVHEWLRQNREPAEVRGPVFAWPRRLDAAKRSQAT